MPAGRGASPRAASPRSSGSRGSGRRPGTKATPYRRSSGRPAPRGRSRAGRKPAPRTTNPLVILIGWIAAVLSGIWMALAHTVGAAARAFGRSARDMDPAHQRDGVGFLAVCAAIITAAALWWHLGLIGRPLTEVLRGAFGSGAWTVPILLVLLAIRFLRHPDNNADTGRMVIGWTALLVGALGLVHIADGTPSPADGGAAMRAAGGLIGYAAAAPLVHLVTKWAAAPVLTALAAFGLLVITGTPLHQLPNRLAELHGFMWGARPPRTRSGTRTRRPWTASSGTARPGRTAGPGSLGRGRSRRPAAWRPASTTCPTTRPCWAGRSPAARPARPRPGARRPPTPRPGPWPGSGPSPRPSRSRTGWPSRRPARCPAAPARSRPGRAGRGRGPRPRTRPRRAGGSRGSGRRRPRAPARPARRAQAAEAGDTSPSS